MPTPSKIAKYKQLLSDLLPQGRLWDLLNQPVLSKLIGAMAVEFARIDDQIQIGIIESDPARTEQLIDEWERLLGLPDSCSEDDATLEERRLQIVTKYTNVGGLSGQYYEFLTAQLGYPSTVTKWQPFLAGKSRAGDPLTNDFHFQFTAGMPCNQQLENWGWLFYFNVEVPVAAAEVFEAGHGVAGDPLRRFSNHLIECTIKKLKPAYAGVTFTFKE